MRTEAGRGGGAPAVPDAVPLQHRNRLLIDFWGARCAPGDDRTGGLPVPPSRAVGRISGPIVNGMDRNTALGEFLRSPAGTDHPAPGGPAPTTAALGECQDCAAKRSRNWRA